MIKSLNKTLPPPSKPLNWPLRVQDSLRMRREDLPGRTCLVGAAVLHPMVQVGQGGKFGLGRCAAISARKRPLFDACRQIYPENFGQGFKSGRRREVPWVRDHRALVLDDGPHFRLERCAAGSFSRGDLRASRYMVRSLPFRCPADMCHFRCFKFNMQ